MSRKQAEAAGMEVPPGAGGTVHYIKYERQDPTLPTSGWMPAGTYMPLKDEPIKGHQFAKYPASSRMNIERLYEAPASGYVPPGYESLEKGISATIPAYSRRFPSRIATWSNMGDEYDLLEDAP